MRWQYTFDNFTEASWGSVAQSFIRDAGFENVSIGEVSVVKDLGKWVLCILAKLCPEFTFDTFSDNKIGGQDSI